MTQIFLAITGIWMVLTFGLIGGLNVMLWFSDAPILVTIIVAALSGAVLGYAAKTLLPEIIKTSSRQEAKVV